MEAERQIPEMVNEELVQLRQRVLDLETSAVQNDRIQKILDKSEQGFKRLVQYLTDYIYTVVIENNEVVYTYHGPGCVAVTGYESQDFGSDPDLWHQMIYEDDREKVINLTQKALAGETVPPFEHRIIHKDKSIRWIKNTIVLNKDEKGKLRSYDGLINDITVLKTAEEEAKIQQQQLIQADKLASLGVLAAGVAHEISNPNNFILLNAQLLKEAWQDIHPVLDAFAKENPSFIVAGIPYSEIKDHIEALHSDILAGSNRIKTIVKSLKSYARQDQGEFNQSVDINAVIKSTIRLTRNLIKKSTRQFSVKYGKDLPTIRGNFLQLEQVFVNLITNACHSIQDADRAVRISSKLADDDEAVIVNIEDEGVGIDPEHLSRIFDPFFTTKRDSRGTGLGLSISYQIIKDHKGSIRLTSNLDEGTKATVKLPV